MRADLSFSSSSSPSLEDRDEEEEKRLISIMGIGSDGRNESIGLILFSLRKYCGGGSVPFMDISCKLFASDPTSVAPRLLAMLRLGKRSEG